MAAREDVKTGKWRLVDSNLKKSYCTFKSRKKMVKNVKERYSAWFVSITQRKLDVKKQQQMNRIDEVSWEELNNNIYKKAQTTSKLLYTFFDNDQKRDFDAETENINPQDQLFQYLLNKDL